MLGDSQSMNPTATGNLCRYSNEVFDEPPLAHWPIPMELETPVGEGMELLLAPDTKEIPGPLVQEPGHS